MTIPKLKRVKVSSEQELRSWLAKNGGVAQHVMIVTCNKTSPDKYIRSEDVRRALLEQGWTAGQSFTLSGNLTGHVARHT